jgi:hypothetical protein
MRKYRRVWKVANDRYRLRTVVMDALLSFNFAAILYKTYFSLGSRVIDSKYTAYMRVLYVCQVIYM